MPELIEAELYRNALEPLLGWSIVAVELCDPDFLRPRDVPPEVFEQLIGRRLAGTRRLGKIVLLDLEPRELVLSLRFGMTGRLVVGGDGPIERLEYSSGRNEPDWDRFRCTFRPPRARSDARDVVLAINDPRRLGNVELDPDLEALGPDAVSLTRDVLAQRLAGRTAPVKSLLLNQAVVAGLGNLLADEVLFRAGLAPQRPADGLTDEQTTSLNTAIDRVLTEQLAAGGSHTGPLFPERHDGGRCPIDGAELRSDSVGGRTAWWCPEHQR